MGVLRMTLLWTSVHGLLVVEVALVLLLLLSWISTQWWCSLVAAINKHIENAADTILQYSGVKTAIEALNATWIYDVRRKLFNAQVIFWVYVGLVGRQCQHVQGPEKCSNIWTDTVPDVGDQESLQPGHYLGESKGGEGQVQEVLC